MERRFDLIVVGAGPAGASCAWRAAELGLSVAVLERERFPRVKHCAAGLSPRGLERVGAIAPPPLHREFRSVELVLGDRTTLVWTADEPLMATSTRSELDAALADAARSAGALIEFGTRVEAVGASGDGVRTGAAGREWSGRFVVAADGARGAVRSLVGAKDGRLCGAAYVNAFPPGGRAGELERGRITFDLRGTRRGYGWVFPKRDHLNVGVYTRLPLSKTLADDLRAFVSARGLDEWRLEGPFAFPLPSGARGWTLVALKGLVLFAGDAAGLADPATGEGISHAIASGRAAAEAVAGSLRAGESAAAAYARCVAREILPEVRFLAAAGSVSYALGSSVTDRLLSVGPLREGLVRVGPWRRLGPGTGRLSVEATARARRQ